MLVFEKLVESGGEISKYTLPTVLKCRMDLCRSVHAHIVKSGFAMLKGVGDAVLHMYVKVGAVQHAMTAFHLIHDPDTFSWNTLPSGFYSGSNCEQGLRIFKQMICEGFLSNKYTYVGVLRCCTSLMNLRYGS